MKPIPKPLYPCLHCAEDYSWPASDLNWSEVETGWVCHECWDERDFEEKVGVCLADELEKSYLMIEANAIETWLKRVPTSNRAVRISDVRKSAQKYSDELRKKAQED